MALDTANKATYSVFTPPVAPDKRQGYVCTLYSTKSRGNIIRATANADLEVGVFVFNAGSDTLNGFAKIDKPTATGRNILGVSVFNRAFTLDWNATLNAYQYKRNSLVAYASEGTYYMWAETAVDIGDKVFFRHTANGALNRIGALTNATGTGLDAHPNPNVHFAEKISAPGLVAVCIP